MEAHIEKQMLKTMPARLEDRTGNQGVLRLGIIGCGYVTTMSHLPACQHVQEIELTALVDVRSNVAGPLAEQYHVPFFTADYHDIFDQVDAVIIALPHHLHAQVALDFLDRGIHVLVEKPMATSMEECRQMIETANYSGAKLAVGLVRRFYDSSRLVKRILDTNFLGSVQSFDVQEAVLFDRFNASAFTVLPPSGGVLWDTGPHTLDLLLWWLGDLTGLLYWDDARGGVEANCRMEITTVQGVPGVVEFSRTRRLGNKIKIICEQGLIEFTTQDPNRITVKSTAFSGSISLARLVAENEVPSLSNYFARQLANFKAAIFGEVALEIPGEEGMRSVAIIEQCKRIQHPLELQPWEKINPNVIRGLE